MLQANKAKHAYDRVKGVDCFTWQRMGGELHRFDNDSIPRLHHSLVSGLNMLCNLAQNGQRHCIPVENDNMPKVYHSIVVH